MYKYISLRRVEDPPLANPRATGVSVGGPVCQRIESLLSVLKLLSFFFSYIHSMVHIYIPTTTDI